MSWSRWSAKHRFDVIALREESLLNQYMRDMTYTWYDLQAMSQTWRAALSEWRGVYFILEVSDGMGYVGSASGSATFESDGPTMQKQVVAATRSPNPEISDSVFWSAFHLIRRQTTSCVSKQPGRIAFTRGDMG